MRLTLLSRAYCHLCDEMREAVAPIAAARGVGLDTVDTDAHPALEARWGDFVPVLLAGAPEDGVEICHYRLDRARLDAALAGADPVAAALASEPKIR